MDLRHLVWLLAAPPLAGQMVDHRNAAAHFPSSSTPGGVLRQLSIASFSGSGQNSIQAIATDPSGNIFVAGTTSSPDFPATNAAQSKFGESRILRTTDLGVTWTGLGGPPDASVVAADPVLTQVLFAGGNTGISKSTDGGQNWRLVYPYPSGNTVPGAFTEALVIDPANHLRLAAIPPSGVPVTSVDGGETWTAGGSLCVLSSCRGARLFADPSGSGTLLALLFGLYISRDWGQTFAPLGPPGPGPPSAAAFDPSHPGWIYVGTSAGVVGSLWLSTDFGATWTVKASPPTIFSGIVHLIVDPDQSNTLVAATVDGLFKSSDGAASWVRQSGPGSSFLVQGNLAFALVSHHCNAAGGLFALGSAGIGTYQAAFSPDYGATWMTPRLTQVNSVASGPGCAFYATRQGTSDAFVAKLAPDGTQLWATFLGGSDQDAPVGLVLDSQGNAYVTGNTTSPDFPSTVPRIGDSGQSSAFVTRFSPQGRIDYSVLFSGESRTTVSAIAVDGSLNAYVAGQTNSQRFPVTPGTLGTHLNEGSFSGFLLKISSSAAPIYATYLGESYTVPGAVLVNGNEEAIIAGTGVVQGSTQGSTDFVMMLDRNASRISSLTYLSGSNPFGKSPSALAVDADNNLFIAGRSLGGTFPSTPGAYTSPASPAGCPQNIFSPSSGGDVYVTKLAAADWKPIYAALLRAPCGIQPGVMAVDRAGAVVLAVATGRGLPLHTPLLGGPACDANSSALAKISRDGSTLEFATYLDNCGVPGIALAPDGTIYAGVSPNPHGSPAGVLHLSASLATGISLDQISNAFSGDASAVVKGGLYSLTGTGLQLPTIDLGLNPTRELPLEINNLRVTFDGVPAAILQSSPGRVIVAPSLRRPGQRENGAIQGFTAVEVIYNGVSSNIVWMPLSKSLPGLLSLDFPNALLHSDFADGNVRNQDGTVNNADHPAATGSTITLFATGLGPADPLIAPGSVTRSLTVPPVIPVYTTWDRFSPIVTPAPSIVNSVPGFIASLFQIRVRIPDSIQGLGGIAVGNGVQRVPVALQFGVPFSSRIQPVSNYIGIYIK